MWDGWGQRLFFGICGGEIVLHFLWKLTTGGCLLGSDLVFLLFFFIPVVLSALADKGADGKLSSGNLG